MAWRNACCSSSKRTRQMVDMLSDDMADTAGVTDTGTLLWTHWAWVEETFLASAQPQEPLRSGWGGVHREPRRLQGLCHTSFGLIFSRFSHS